MAEVLRYVNIASTAGGNGTTNATTGPDRAYASLSEWNAAEQTDLVAAGDTHRVLCSNTGIPAVDTAQCLIQSWVTGASNTLTVEQAPSDRTFGVIDSSKYKLRSVIADSILDVRQSHVTVLYIQMERNQPSTSNSNRRGMDCRGVIRLEGLIVKGVDTVSTGTGILDGIVCSSIGNDIDINNCLVYGFSHPTKTYRGIDVSAAGGTNRLVNNTFINNDIHIKTVGTTNVVCKNMILQDGGTDIDGTILASSDYNLTDQVSFPTGSNNVTSSTLTFVDKAGEDFHLVSSDTDAIDAGIGPGSDADVPTTDVDGDPRSGATTSIGFHYFVSVPPVDTGIKTWHEFFLRLTGLNSISFNDKSIEYLKGKGVFSTTLNGALYEWLGGKGYTGALDDRIRQWGDDGFPE